MPIDPSYIATGRGYLDARETVLQNRQREMELQQAPERMKLLQAQSGMQQQELDLKKLEAGIAKADRGMQILSSAVDEPSWRRAIQIAKAEGYDTKQFENFPYTEDVRSQLGRMLLSQKDQMTERLYTSGLKGGSRPPAPIQIANAIREAQDRGDTEMATLLQETAKLYEKGQYKTPEGKMALQPGYASAAQDTAYSKETGTNISDLEYKPQIAGDVASATAQGKDYGEVMGTLASMKSRMPQLEAMTKKLSKLGKISTYTQAGQIFDAAQRELGMDIRDSAVARAAYVSMVDNEILPLLRETFGAQFTRAEGESLKVTLGDPNKHPREKDAVIRSFINAKVSQIESFERRQKMGLKSPGGGSFTGQTPTAAQPSRAVPTQEEAKAALERRRSKK